MEYREFRTSATESEGKLSGLGAPFNSETMIGDPKRGGWRETIAPGAFKKTIAEGDTVLLCDHDMSKPLARVSAGTLTLRESQKGLEFEGTPADTTYARDLAVNVRAGNKGGMSIGFNIVKDSWYDDKGNESDRYEGTKRVIREVGLPELSCVTNPAYKNTSVMARDELLAEREARAAGRDAKDGDGPNPKKPYGNVPYADPKNGKYPIDKSHVKAAWAYINQAKNAAKYPLNGVSLASVKAKIKAAMKKFGFISGSAGESKSFEFYNPEWRDDDPFFDDWYELDDTEEDDRSEFPDLTAIAADFIKMYNELPADMRSELPEDMRTAIEALVRSQEPETSTPENEDDDFALFAMERERSERSRELGVS